MIALLKDVDKNILWCSRQNGRQQNIEPAYYGVAVIL